MKPRVKLVDGVWRDAHGESREYWRCVNGTIFCGGEYRPRLGLCTNCRTLKYHQTAGRETHRHVFTLYNRGYVRHGRPNGGSCLSIRYHPSLFQSRIRREWSYPRVLHERVTGTTLSRNEKVVYLGTNHIPEFHQLVVVDAADVREPQLRAVLHARGL